MSRAAAGRPGVSCVRQLGRRREGRDQNGIVQIDQHTESVATLLSAADIACYSAQDGGRNRVQVYDPASASARHREMCWMARLMHTRDEGRLDIMFQPIVRVAS